MKRRKCRKPRLTLGVSLIAFLLLIIGCQYFPSEKAHVPSYPLLRERFDPDFQKALETALKNEFQGEYKQAVENKKAAFVVVDITDMENPKVAGVNPDVMLYAASHQM